MEVFIKKRKSYIRDWLFTILLLNTLVFLTENTFAQVKKPLHLFVIGNSFSQNATKYLPQLSEEGGYKLIIGRAELGGCSLKKHWESVVANDADSDDAKGRPYKGKSLREMLSEGTWDVVSLQQYSLLSGDADTYMPYADHLYQLIKKLQPGAKVVLHQTWAYRIDANSFGKIKGETRAKDQTEMWKSSRAAYHTVASKIGLGIIPSGDAFQKVNVDARWGVKPVNFNKDQAVYPVLPNQDNSIIVGYSYDKEKKMKYDAKHANEIGCYLAGLVWYSFLFQDDPSHLNFKPDQVSPEFAAFLKQVTKDVTGI